MTDLSWNQPLKQMDNSTYQHILTLLRQEVKPALGCTEPIALAIAVARACAEFPGITPDKVSVAVSANILKNGMGVGIPGTGMVGLPIAAALAVTCGNHEYGLEVLKDLDRDSVAAAKAFVDAGKVSITLAHDCPLLYIDAVCSYPGGESSRAMVQDSHDHIALVERNGEVLLDDRVRPACAEDGKAEEAVAAGDGLTLEQMYEFARTADLADLDIVRQGADMNKALAKEGVTHNYGLRVGKTIESNVNNNIFGYSLVTRCMTMTAAASDARMAGCTLPAMSNSGSGNQGITASMPVVAAAEHLMSSHEDMIRALTLSNLVAIHIKSYLGKLSALCGCVIASTGSACGIVMLYGGSFKQICHAVKNMIGDITGMVCDGAKEGCAMKVASGVSSAVQSAVLALSDICVSRNDGIIDDDVEKTISNLGKIGSKGMRTTDEMILDIMVCK